MKTEITISGDMFYINGSPTYKDVVYGGRKVEGLLFNSRMVQAIFDDANNGTKKHWVYPDTGTWDPERNVQDFIIALPEYRRHGLLGVTVGLQGGGSVYTPDIYENYDNSAYEADGTFRQAYFDRLLRVIKAADSVGMVVIVNYFYVKHARRLINIDVIKSITERVTDWLLQCGYRNILVDVANEFADWWKNPPFEPDSIHRLIEIVQSIKLDGRRLLAGSSSGGGQELPHGRWQEIEDFHMPHGNGLCPDELRKKLKRLKSTGTYRQHPKPVLINEDSVFISNLEAALDEYCSWGFYHQGYGSAYKDLSDWTLRPRETRYEELTGFQTVPVNWSINDTWKKAFFEKVNEITQSDPSL